MKVVKILLKVVVALVLLAVLAIAALPLWFGPVVKAVANSSVPTVVKADFHLGKLSLNPYTGRFELGDMQLSNPNGFSEKYAAKVGDVLLAVETGSLMTDIVHIEEIKVNDVFVSIVQNRDGVGNFDQLKYNAAGGKEKYEAKQAESEKQASAGKATEPDQKRQASTEGSEKKFIIDKMSISGLKVQLGMFPVMLPPITLTNIGSTSSAASAEEVWAALIDAVMKAAGGLGDGLKALGGMSSNAFNSAAGAAGSAAKITGTMVGSAASVTTNAVSGTIDVIGGGAKKATGMVGDGAKKATDAVGEGTKKAADAVGDGAKKTVDALKKLF